MTILPEKSIIIMDDPWAEPECPFPRTSNLGRIHRIQADHETRRTVLRWFDKMLENRPKLSILLSRGEDVG